MPRAYCELADVKRILRSQSLKESRIRFSDVYKDLKVGPSNTGSMQLSGVHFLSSYAGHESFTFTFSDSTSFDVVGDVEGSVGSGTSESVYTAAEKFTTTNEDWAGRAVAGDVWYITANSDMSDDDGDDFISDISRLINSKLKQSYGDLPDFTGVSSTDTIPDAVVYASMRYAAYEIFNSVYAGSSTDEESPVEKWKTMADEAMSDYIKGGVDGPRWRARDSLVTELGVEGVGEGVLNIAPVGTAKNEDFQR